MTAHQEFDSFGPEKTRRMLEVTRDLARPMDLGSLLYQIVDAAKELLDAEGGTVWQYHMATHELETRASRGLETLRIPADRGIVGECVRSRATINVPDCYADARFDRRVDRDSGQRTRCMLTLPLVGHDEELVGILQVLNRRVGVFGADDEAMADLLAAQCAVALQRALMTERLLRSEGLRQEIAVARDIQLGSLPQAPPTIAGYDLAGTFRPADETGGDTYDFVPAADGGLMILMGDATGHGIGPALSALQVRAMLRLAQRLGADLDDTFRHINDQLAADLPEDRFVTAFLGHLDPVAHVLRYHSGGQGPLLHWHAVEQRCDVLPPTTFPLGAMPLGAPPEAQQVELAPGDIFALLSDGVFEYHDADERQFGEQAVVDLLKRHHRLSMAGLRHHLLDALVKFGGGAGQRDDVTIVLIRRIESVEVAAVGGSARRSFPRSYDALEAVFAWLHESLAGRGANEADRYAVDFAVEELFTNMVKYNLAGVEPIELGLAFDRESIVCTISDPDSDRFDVTAAPDADIEAPVEQRRPGGLGLHLIRRLVDSVEYDYSGRCSRISFRRQLGRS